MDTRTLVKQISRFHENYEKEFLRERIRNKNTYLKWGYNGRAWNRF